MTDPAAELIAAEWRAALRDADGLAVWLHECLLAVCSEIMLIGDEGDSEKRQALAVRATLKAFAAVQLARRNLGLPAVVASAALAESIVPVVAVHERALRAYPEIVEPQRAAWRRKKAEAEHGRR